MMDTGQRVKLVKQRAWEKLRMWEKRKTRRLSLLSVMLCCCLIYAAWYFKGGAPGAVQGMNGATMLLENAGGYVLVGLVSFIAAVVITVLCLRAKEKSKKQDKQTKEDEEQ